MMEQEKSSRELYGIKDDAMLDEMYDQAYRLYNTGSFYNASTMFRILMGINPLKQEYVMGLASCFHMMKQYQPAMKIYQIAGVLDPYSPLPFYHAADCLMQLDDPITALSFLEMAVERSSSNEEYQTLKETALLMIQGLKKKEGLL